MSSVASPRVRKSPPVRRLQPSRGTLVAQGEPMIWLTGGALALSLAMIGGLLSLILVQGAATFWPGEIVQLKQLDGAVRLGEVDRIETYRPTSEMLAALAPALREDAYDRIRANQGQATRRLVRTGNYDLTQTHFHWVDDYLVADESRPEWAVVLERETGGRFHGFPVACELDGQPLGVGPAAAWSGFRERHDGARALWDQQRDLLRRSQRVASRSDPEIAAEFQTLRVEVARLDQEIARLQLRLRTAANQEQLVPLAAIVRGYAANQLGWFERLGVYGSRWAEFLSQEPREANSEGGVFPAIFGTVVMTLVMSLLVVPFGVLAALYMREYARPGLVLTAVRIAINNLAGVPSIVFGVFGLGFFCYIVGGGIDAWFFADRLPSPTFGKGALVWASFTLALMTLPVVIVATEEALAAVPGSMREGSYACGASKWQTIQRIVLPRALPGVMTGMILAMARGAGEVAPLMLVGAVKLAPELPVDGRFPFLHPERSFMHLGFHIYDLGFHSQNSEASRPMVYTTTLLLIVIIAVLNVTAVMIRSRLRKRFHAHQF